ncbi:hypothetical protein T4D_606 [Trichinella pseudospiralis]|uniref:Uncharacterized protein n=1 Tax=Trichinella pseudospiralis TaxID=6337 RepID=A0A0V1FED9_TRIPS|nr:hypothetical protein T4D_606 [Trichinella pseudospiralis]
MKLLAATIERSRKQIRTFSSRQAHHIFPAVNKHDFDTQRVVVETFAYNTILQLELTNPVSDRVTSQTVTGDDLSFQAVLEQMRPLNALHIAYLHTASCVLPLGEFGGKKHYWSTNRLLTQANRRRDMTKLIMAAGQDNKLATTHCETMARVSLARDRPSTVVILLIVDIIT